MAAKATSSSIAASAMHTALTGSSNNVAGTTTTTTAPIVENPSSGTVLTVGAGMEFASLSAALNASANGDTILVEAGTYYNDFSTVNTSVTVLAMGGVVNEVATEPPPNDKGIILVNANLTIQGFTFTGGSDGSPDGNVAGIRYQAGNLSVQYCDFTNMQDGLLATPGVTGTGTITINESEFSDCGTGDGLTHDIYVGPVASFTLTNSYIHNAIVGHEVKSRAAVTTIENNVIADGPGGSSSYEIDIPNGGVAVVSGNTLEKGPDASNQTVVHYGGETQYAWSSNALTVSNNIFLDDYPGQNAIAVNNQSTVNGLSVAVNFTGNSVYGFQPGNLIGGAGTATSTTYLATEPGYSTAEAWMTPPAVSLGSGNEVLNLATSGSSVSGGAALFVVTDSAGFNMITAGTGGLHFTDSVGWDTITTAASATDSMTLNGRNNVVYSAGHDTIIDNGTYDAINASGAAKITGNSFATYMLSGAETVTVNGSGVLDVLATGTVSGVIGTLGVNGSLALGGSVVLSSSPKGGMADTIGGASGTFGSDNGLDFSLAFASGNGVATLGGGNFSVSGGTGNDSFTLLAGSGNLTLGNGHDSVAITTGGTDLINAGTGTDAFTIAKGSTASTITIQGFRVGIDTLAFTGFANPAIKSGTVTAAGDTLLQLANGSVVDLVAASLPGYPGSPTVSGGGGSSGGGTSTVSGGITLTSSGQSITGGASLLTITDGAGGNSIAGGSGGIDGIFLVGDAITSFAGASNSVTLAGGDSMIGGGGDSITITDRYNLVWEQGSGTILLNAINNTVEGGAGLLSVVDNDGGNLILGGSGGVVLSGSNNYDSVTTAQGATDTLTMGGYGVINLYGNDALTLTGNYDYVYASGADVIQAGSGFSDFDLQGTATVSGTGAGLYTVGGAANATLISSGAGGSAISLLQGGTVALSQTIPGGANATITVAGGSASLTSSGTNYPGISLTTTGQGDSITTGTGPATIASAGPDTIWAGAGTLTVNASGSLLLHGGSGTVSVTAGAAGVDVLAGSGNITLQGGQGNDSFTGGSGNAVLDLGGGADSITLINGTAGHDTITGWGASDTLAFQGYGTTEPVATQSVLNGNTYLTLTDGSTITLINTVAHF